MSPDPSVTVDPEAGTLQIDELVIADPDVVSFLADQPKRASAESLKQIIRVGVQSLRVAETSRDVDYVDRRVDAMQNDLEAEIEDLRNQISRTFEDEGNPIEQQLNEHLREMERMIADELDADTERIQNALHPDEGASPLGSVKSEITSLREKLVDQQARASERKYDPRKGDEFEDKVEAVLQQNIIGPIDSVERTATIEGTESDNLKGDFVVTTSSGERIALEVKDRTSDYPATEIDSYLAETLENREADYAVMVLRNTDAPPNKLGWFHEFDRQRLSIVLTDSVDDEPDWRLLRFSLNWARTRVAQARAGEFSEYNEEAIEDDLNEVRDLIDDFEEIRGSARSIHSQASDIEEQAQSMERRMRTRLAAVQAELGIAE